MVQRIEEAPFACVLGVLQVCFGSHVKGRIGYGANERMPLGTAIQKLKYRLHSGR